MPGPRPTVILCHTMPGRLRLKVALLPGSEPTLRTVEQNFWFATATNVIGIALGMSGVLAPVMAGAVHVAHAAGIMLNSSRLLGWEGPSPTPSA